MPDGLGTAARGDASKGSDAVSSVDRAAGKLGVRGRAGNRAR